MNLAGFDKIAPHLSSPMVLVGFVLLLAYSIHWQLMKSGLLSQVTKKDSSLIIQLFLHYGFWLALVLLVAGFGLAGWIKYVDKVQPVDTEKLAVRLIAPLKDELTEKNQQIKKLHETLVALTNAKASTEDIEAASQALKQTENKRRQIKEFHEALTALLNASVSSDIINTALQDLEERKVKSTLDIFSNILEQAEKKRNNEERAAAARHIATLDVLNRIASLPLHHSFSIYKTSNKPLLEWQEPRAGKMMTWHESHKYVEKKNKDGLMGYYDWRLPTIKEIQELAAFIRTSPYSYSDIDELYWSSEDFGPYSVEAKVVNLGNARMSWYDTDNQIVTRSKDHRFAVRLVRRLNE